MDLLPSEIVTRLLTFLRFCDILSLARCSRRLYELTKKVPPDTFSLVIKLVGMRRPRKHTFTYASIEANRIPFRNEYTMRYHRDDNGWDLQYHNVWTFRAYHVKPRDDTVNRQLQLFAQSPHIRNLIDADRIMYLTIDSCYIDLCFLRHLRNLLRGSRVHNLEMDCVHIPYHPNYHRLIDMTRPQKHEAHFPRLKSCKDARCALADTDRALS